MPSRKIFSLFGSIAIEGMAGTKKELSEFQKDIVKTNRALNKMGRDITKTGKAITKGLTLPLVAAAGAAIKFGADFDQAMTNSIAIMGDVSDAMRKDLEQTARDVAKETKFSATQAAEAYFFLASAGLDAAESMAALPKVAKFAQAGNFDLARATDLLTDAQSALGMSSDDTAENMENMARVSDTLVKANTLANASVSEFSEAMTNKAGAALRLLGKDVEEGASVLAVYADQGVKGAEAGTQLNIVLRDLQKAAVNNKKGFKEAGVSVFDAQGEMRNMADIVSDLEGRLSGMSDEQRRTELSSLGFTEKSVSATAALIGTSDAMREYEDALRDASGATQEVSDKQLQTFWVQLGLVKDAAIDLGLTLFNTLRPVLMDTIIPALKQLIEVVAQVIKWFGEHKNIALFVATFVSMIAVAGPILLALGKMWVIVKNLVLLYKALTAAQITLNAVMAANPIGLIITLIAALIAVGVLLWKNWDLVSEKFKEVWGGIKAYAKIVFGILGQMVNDFVLGILKGLNKVGRFIPGLNKGLAATIKAMERNKKAVEEWTDAQAKANQERKRTNALTKEEKEAIEGATEAAKIKGEVEEENSEKKKKKTLEEIEDEKKKAALAKKTAKEVAAEKMRIDNELEQSRIVLIADRRAKLKASTDQRLKELEQARDKEIEEARKAGIATEKITQTYANRRKDIERDAAKEERKIVADTQKERIDGIQRVIGIAQDIIGRINALWRASLNKRKNEIDAEAEARKKALESSVMSVEERNAAIAAIDEEAAAKKQELEKENAKRQKAATLFGIGLNTALAVASALTVAPPLGIVLAGIVGALGAAQLAIAAATPIPFAKGGLVRKDPGTGIIAQIGEGQDDELVLPMKAGAQELADGIMQRITRGQSGTVAASAMGKMKEVHTHLHIGTLIADEFGLKKLSKTLNKYTVAEAQRTGA